MNCSVNLIIATLTIICFMSGFQDPPQPARELVGRWNMRELYENGNDVTNEHNPAGNRYAVFNEDGTFESGGDPYGKNSGKWLLEETPEGLLLYLDSDAGSGDDSYWLITLEGKNMQWRGARSEFTKRFVVNLTKADS
ncbi:lipocalin family protein [Roseivirga sp. BDSF3-8]|uniref:lipocalin family protein n=1 Tax=Roseivirga sp. BDSF3-8 TaxID=3241598 RepID=UPI003531DB78